MCSVESRTTVLFDVCCRSSDVRLQGNVANSALSPTQESSQCWRVTPAIAARAGNGTPNRHDDAVPDPGRIGQRPRYYRANTGSLLARRRSSRRSHVFPDCQIARRRSGRYPPPWAETEARQGGQALISWWRQPVNYHGPNRPRPLARITCAFDQEGLARPVGSHRHDRHFAAASPAQTQTLLIPCLASVAR